MSNSDNQDGKIPDVFRTSDGRVFQGGSQLSKHKGYWWYDVGVPIAPVGAEQNLPLWDPPGGTWSVAQHEDNKRSERIERLPAEDSQKAYGAMREGGAEGDWFERLLQEQQNKKTKANSR
jgi:hypothetical protein